MGNDVNLEDRVRSALCVEVNPAGAMTTNFRNAVTRDRVVDLSTSYVLFGRWRDTCPN